MSEPNEPPHDDGRDGGPTPPLPGQFQPPPPGQFQPPAPGQFPGPGQFPQPAQPPAQPFVPGYDAEGWVPELGVRIAPAGARIGAKAIDMVIVLLLNIAVSIIAVATLIDTDSAFTGSGDFSTSATATGGLDIGIAAALTLQAVLVLVDLVYNVVIPARFGGQPGKLMLGLRIIRQDGGQLDGATAFRRWAPVLALIVLSLVPFVGLFASFGRILLLAANLALVLTDERRRDVFDRVASTYVITTR